MQITEVTGLAVATAAAVTAVVLQLSKKKPDTNDREEECSSAQRHFSISFSKEAHDELCLLKLAPIRLELKAIREQDLVIIRDHEANAKESVRDVKENIKEIKENITQIWSRINNLVEETHNNHVEIMKALK